MYENSKQYKDGKFNHTEVVPKDLSFNEKLKLAYTFFTTKIPNGRPKKDLDVIKLDSTNIADYHESPRMVWFGHSSFLLQMEGENILLDPMFGQVAAPHDLLGKKRFNEEMPLAMEKLPQIDAVIFSHEHYDHLDYILPFKK